jgi:hypothetical protein
MAYNFQEITKLLKMQDDSNCNLSKNANKIPLVVHFDLTNRFREQRSTGEDDIQGEFSFLANKMPKSLPKILLIRGEAPRSKSVMKACGGTWASSFETHRVQIFQVWLGRFLQSLVYITFYLP